MSRWTHVSGCIRLDGMPQIMRMPDIEEILGTPSSNLFLEHEAEPYRTPQNIPSGSEGSIQYAVIDAGTGLVYKTVAVWGDLRDFGAEDASEIDLWFSRIVARWPIIRAAHLLVEVEYGVRYLLVAEEKDVRRVQLSEAAADV